MAFFYYPENDANEGHSDLPVLFPYPRIYPGKGPAGMSHMNTDNHRTICVCDYIFLDDQNAYFAFLSSYMCDLKRKIVKRSVPHDTEHIPRNSRCRGTLCTRDAFGYRQDCVSPLIDRGVSAILSRASEADILLT